MLDHYNAELEQLSAFYTDLVREHGHSPEGVQHKDLESQENRTRILTEVGDLRGAKILDFGCGTGYLYEYLKARSGFEGEYLGVDICAEMIEIATHVHPSARFEHRNILLDGLEEDFDYVLINGTFNNKLDDNWGLITALLKCLFKHTRKGLAFNALSTYVDFFNPGNYYVSPTELFRFCKEELSPSVTLRHDYEVKQGVVPFEFTTYVYASGIDRRSERQP